MHVRNRVAISIEIRRVRGHISCQFFRINAILSWITRSMQIETIDTARIPIRNEVRSTKSKPITSNGNPLVAANVRWPRIGRELRHRFGEHRRAGLVLREIGSIAAAVVTPRFGSMVTLGGHGGSRSSISLT